ncbi:MAG: DUF2490 domain-containing protein [Candidatus Omnitrophica bacterium]|nr:DUF2490 domain-containing protein [Candidatus Omnitrophota bacterium]MBU4487781.1 DUF2490 domain-containing protein [Candidatus Omnitrophota bacterium]MCG2705293.1 DUF2490 domain-containing protein [Candidatus Omnitrophota bacterium]
MKRALFLIAPLIIFVTTPSHAYEDGDFQIWHTENQDMKLTDHAKLTAEEEFRWGDDARELFYQHYDFGAVCTINKNLDLGVNYRLIYEKKSGEFKPENVIHANVTPKLDLWGFKFEDRNRFAYKYFDYQDDYAQYRNKLAIKYPFPLFKLKLEPYVANEMFVDFKDKGGFTQNRLFGGLGIEILKGMKAELYYMFQCKKSSGKWKDANIFGSKFKIAF